MLKSSPLVTVSVVLAIIAMKFFLRNASSLVLERTKISDRTDLLIYKEPSKSQQTANLLLAGRILLNIAFAYSSTTLPLYNILNGFALMHNLITTCKQRELVFETTFHTQWTANSIPDLPDLFIGPEGSEVSRKMTIRYHYPLIPYNGIEECGICGTAGKIYSCSRHVLHEDCIREEFKRVAPTLAPIYPNHPQLIRFFRHSNFGFFTEYSCTIILFSSQAIPRCLACTNPTPHLYLTGSFEGCSRGASITLLAPLNL